MLSQKWHFIINSLPRPKLFVMVGWSDQIFLTKQKINKKCSLIVVTYYKKYNGSCFMYLCEILSKLQVFKVRDFMTFSDGLLIMCNFAYKPHTFIFFYFPLVIITN